MNRKVVLFAIAFLLLIIVIYMQVRQPQEVTTQSQTISVVVASRDVPPFTVLSAKDVRTEQLDPSLALDSFGGLTEPVGLMTTTEVRAGSPIHRSEALTPDVNWTEGQMLVFSFYVPTSRIVGGQLRPGHHIDLLATRGETRDLPAESLWMAQNLWVVGVYQSSGEDVPRPPVGIPETTSGTPAANTGTLGFAQASGSGTAREGPANLVVVAASRETGKVIGDYLGARLYEAWVYVRPGTLEGDVMVATGRLDGVVFEDRNQDLFQQRSEPGLDNVMITLYNESNTEVGKYETDSGGTFQFTGLQTGIYYVEEQDPVGYISVTPNRLRVEIANGLNQHVIFGDQLPAAAEETTKKVTATPAATPTPASPPAKPTPQPEVGTKVCECRLTMSQTELGAAASVFALTDTVWANIEFVDCPKNLAYTVRVLYAEASTEERVNGVFTWEGGSGRKAVEIKPWRGDKTQFEPGVYTTYVRVGPDDVVYAYAQWTVAAGGTGGQGGTTGPGVGLPVTGAEAGTSFGFDHGR
jgi:Flp pilus assembly protein CpaB